MAEGEFVIIHGRFSGFQPTNWIAADILRIKDSVRRQVPNVRGPNE